MGLQYLKAALLVLTGLALTPAAVALPRMVSPSCDVRLNEICLSGQSGRGLALQAVRVTEQLEDVRYDLTLRDGEGQSYSVSLVKSDALGLPDEALTDGYARVKLRRWNGGLRGTYVITNPHSEVLAQVCVDGWPWMRCARSGSLTQVF